MTLISPAKAASIIFGSLMPSCLPIALLVNSLGGIECAELVSGRARASDQQHGKDRWGSRCRPMRMRHHGCLSGGEIDDSNDFSGAHAKVKFDWRSTTCCS
jgi:hypothetical protein